MPWTATSFRRKHNKRLTLSQAKRAAKIANEILRETGNEGLAVRVANSKVKHNKKRRR